MTLTEQELCVEHSRCLMDVRVVHGYQQNTVTCSKYHRTVIRGGERINFNLFADIWGTHMATEGIL